MTQTVAIAITAEPGPMWDSWDGAISLLNSAGIATEDGRSHEEISPAELQELLADVEGVMVSLTPVIDAAIIRAAPRLRFIGKPGAGMDNIDLEEATRRGIMACNTAGSNTEAVADHTFGLMLAVLRHIVLLDRLTREGKGWERRILGGELWGKTLGIVGTGRIGRAVARRALGFGMTLLGYDTVPDPAFAREVSLTYLPLEDLLARSDLVSVHVPLLPATRGLIGRRELAQTKQGALFFNLARGPVVDEEALVESLRSGHLGGAGLDVFSEEPLVPTSPLLALDNVVVTPHASGFSRESLYQSRIALAEAARDVLQGRVPHTLVNLDVLGRS
jgi:phosphoglycerate dehydrogenase-like enzyme